jgi:hypothetical protein
MSDARYEYQPLSEAVGPQARLLLVRLMEECAEVQQVAAKTLRFGPDSHHPQHTAQRTNRVELQRETLDLLKVLYDLALLPPSITRDQLK